ANANYNEARRQFTGLQVATLIVAYLSLAFFGLRDFYRNATPAPKATPVQINADGSVGLDWTRIMTRALVLLLFAASVLKLSAQSYSPFLYFQF
ncbi:MAG: membrane-bound O-acyltransferase family protein, partial [Pseudomonas sp.]|nr:membrane-bound O-acyltransferase family protein [Pseudomonas sp.]